MKIDLSFNANINNSNVEKYVKDSLQGLPMNDVTELDLSRNKIKDLEWLGDYQNVKILNLNNTAVSSISFLCRSEGKTGENLEELYLISTEVRDISPIKECTNLKKLSLYSLKIKDWTPLMNTNIEELDISDTNISNLEPILYMYRLRKLCLASTDFDEDALLALKELPFLETLELDRDYCSIAQDVLHSGEDIKQEILLCLDNPDQLKNKILGSIPWKEGKSKVVQRLCEVVRALGIFAEELGKDVFSQASREHKKSETEPMCEENRNVGNMFKFSAGDDQGGQTKNSVISMVCSLAESIKDIKNYYECVGNNANKEFVNAAENIKKRLDAVLTELLSAKLRQQSFLPSCRRRENCQPHQDQAAGLVGVIV